MKYFFLFFLTLFLLSSSPVLAHPGRTDSSGCHTCRTNCPSWGLSYGEYHCHNGGTSSGESNVVPIIQTNTPAPTRVPTLKPTPTPYIETDMDKKKMFKVIKVIDGDTFDISIRGKTERVRLLAIDTPESVDPRMPVQCFSKEATVKLQSLINNKFIKLIDDRAQGNRDKYKRLLRYAYDNNLFINREMVVQGYAFSYKQYPTKYLKEFNELEKQAREKNIGLWSSKCNY